MQLSNSKYGERIRHKQHSECTSEVDQEIRQIWATSQGKSPDGDLYPVTLSHDVGGRDGFRTALGCHDAPYLTPVQLGNIDAQDHRSAAQNSL